MVEFAGVPSEEMDESWRHAREAHQRHQSLGVDDDYDGDGISYTERAAAMLADVHTAWRMEDDDWRVEDDEQAPESDDSDAGDEAVEEEMPEREWSPYDESSGGRMVGGVFVAFDV